MARTVAHFNCKSEFGRIIAVRLAIDMTLCNIKDPHQHQQPASTFAEKRSLLDKDPLT